VDSGISQPLDTIQHGPQLMVILFPKMTFIAGFAFRVFI
jgi:hypothetical protein